jgi:hypothetical protein
VSFRGDGDLANVAKSRPVPYTTTTQFSKEGQYIPDTLVNSGREYDTVARLPTSLFLLTI